MTAGNSKAFGSGGICSIGTKISSKIPLFVYLFLGDWFRWTVDRRSI